MSAPAFAGRPALTIRGTSYPILLPSVRDPRLHLAAVIITLQVLGQTAFGFELSIAQILVSLGTCAVLEVGIAFFRHRILMWPASALLTGNGVAFVLRVPGTPHGDWWSLHGAWIFSADGCRRAPLEARHPASRAGTSSTRRTSGSSSASSSSERAGRSRSILVGPDVRVDGPGLVCLIVVGGLTILSRLRLLVIAVAFWARSPPE